MQTSGKPILGGNGSLYSIQIPSRRRRQDDVIIESIATPATASPPLPIAPPTAPRCAGEHAAVAKSKRLRNPARMPSPRASDVPRAISRLQHSEPRTRGHTVAGAPRRLISFPRKRCASCALRERLALRPREPRTRTSATSTTPRRWPKSRPLRCRRSEGSAPTRGQTPSRKGKSTKAKKPRITGAFLELRGGDLNLRTSRDQASSAQSRSFPRNSGAPSVGASVARRSNAPRSHPRLRLRSLVPATEQAPRA